MDYGEILTLLLSKKDIDLHAIEKEMTIKT